MATNLPIEQIEDSAAGTKLFFDSYGEAPLEFSSNDVNTTVAFFTGKGFEKDSALVISTVILKQAKLEGIPVTQILDTIKQFETSELSQLVAEILNNNRVPTSTLGYRTEPIIPNQSRNIAA